MKKVALTALLAGILLEILFFSEAFSAGTFTAFGPKDYTRTTGKPTTAMDNFSVLNPNTSYTLHIYNGGKNNQFKGKVSSAVISLNGAEVVRPNEFNQNVSHIEKPIKLSKDNALAVELRSKADSGLTIEIIGLDTDSPTIVATSAPLPNAAGWNNTDVTVNFVCSDTISGIASCPGPVQVTQEGANQLVTGTATDIAGNTASTSVTFNIDKTPPTIAKVLSPVPNPAGWNSTNVSVGFACSDSTSGVASCPSPMQMENEGANQVASGTATDVAGNTASISAAVNIDKTPPVVTILSPLPGANLQDPSVIVQGTINETLSGVDAITCNGIPANLSNGSFTCDVALVEGDNSIVTAATDLAGNTGSSTITVAFVPAALELVYVDDFELVWEGAGAYFRPVVRGAFLGFYSLGHYGQDNSGTPFGFVLAARALQFGALARPVDFVEVWKERFYPYGSIWRPIPAPGYVCLGMIVQTGYSKPSTDAVRCVRNDLTVPAKLGNTIAMGGYGGEEFDPPTTFSSWQIIPADGYGIFVGTFWGRAFSLNEFPPFRPFIPPTEPLFTIDARRVKKYDLNSAAIEGIIQSFGPDLLFYDSGGYPSYKEDYFLDDPEYVLDYGTMLEWGLVQNETDYDSFSLDILGSVNTSAAGLMQDVQSNVVSSPEFNNDESFRYYLRIDDSLTPGSLDRAKALVRIRPWNWLFTDLQFWFFYPFNGPGRVEVCASGEMCVVQHFDQAGRHYGDWEHVTLRIDNRKQEPVAIYMSRHGGGQWITKNLFGQVLQFNESHPLIYVAKYSHAHYPTEGVHDYERVFEWDYEFGTASVDLRDLTNGAGPRFSTWLPGKYRIISSALPGYQVTEPEWLQFQGRWGQYERLIQPIFFVFNLFTWKEVGVGPTGPAMKSSWVLGDSGKNWWWTRHLEGNEACFDGIDNDGDGEIDCHDPDCWRADPVCIVNGWKLCHEIEPCFCHECPPSPF